MDMDGLGTKLIDQMVEEGLLRARQNLEPSPPAQGRDAESDARPSQRQGSTPDGDPETTHD